MTAEEKERIRDLSKCDFSEINEHFKKVSEERKNRSKEEKKAEKEKNDAIVEEYGFCLMDGHKEKIGNFRIEPPGLFRGRGEHPKQGMIKRRTMPEDVIINCSKDSEQPMPPKVNIKCTVYLYLLSLLTQRADNSKEYDTEQRNCFLL